MAIAGDPSSRSRMVSTGLDDGVDDQHDTALNQMITIAVGCGVTSGGRLDASGYRSAQACRARHGRTHRAMSTKPGKRRRLTPIEGGEVGDTPMGIRAPDT